MKPRALLSVVISIFIFSSMAIGALNDAANDLLEVGYKKLDKNDYEAAIENFNKALSLDLGDSQAYVGLGNVYARKGDIEAAIENFNKALSFDLENLRAYNGLGNAYAKKGDTEAAMKSFNKAITFKPDNAYAYAGLYNLYSSLNDADSMLKKEEVLKKLEKLDKSLADKICGPRVK